ncbi:MAG: hypothetical protein ACREJ6_06780 [Candidatus Methylomirabilis sp.]
MGQTSRLLTHGIALIVAMFLWLNPFCLLPELDTVGHHSAASSEQDHSSHPKALCDDHLLHAAGIGHDADISAKAGIGPRIPPPAGVPQDRFLVVSRYGLVTPLIPNLSISPSSSKALYTLHSVYLI